MTYVTDPEGAACYGNELLDTARDCKRYVEDALEKLIEYTTSGTEAGPTLH
jgi:hypothetical protein